MERFNGLANKNEIILVVSTNTESTIVFFWKNGALDVCWYTKDNILIPLSQLERMVMGFTIVEDESKRLRVQLGLPIHTDKTLYLVSNDGQPQLMFQHPETREVFTLYEIFVDLSNKEIAKCFCRCLNVKSNESYVECFDVEMSFFSIF